MNKYTPTILTIAGSDPYGGAGVQVDAKTIHALDGYAFTVTTALTAQNSTGVKALSATSKAMFKMQLESLLDDIYVDAVKIGMLANTEIIEVVVEVIQKYKLKNIVLDTVLVSSSGKMLLEKSAIEVMVEKLFPLVDLITPNLLEINQLLNRNYKGYEEEAKSIGLAFFDLGVKAVLVKGGHSYDTKNATDFLVEKLSLVEKASLVTSYTTPRVKTTHTHGTGCVLSSAIATSLAHGKTLQTSVKCAKDFLYKSMQSASSITFKYVNENEKRKEPLI